MRNVLLLALMTSGCAAGDFDIEHLSTLTSTGAPIRGLAMKSGDRGSNVGLNDLVCDISAVRRPQQVPTMLSDIPMPAAPDRLDEPPVVLDGAPPRAMPHLPPSDDAVLARTSGRLHLLTAGGPTGGWALGQQTLEPGLRVVTSVDLEGVTHARFGSERVIASSGCDVWWLSPGLMPASVSTLPDDQGTCDVAAIEPHPDQRLAFVASGGEILRVVPNDVGKLLGVRGDRMVYSASERLLFVAQDGHDVVEAVTDDGEVVWSTTVDGSVIELQSIDEADATLVATRLGDRIHLIVLDASTGEEILVREFPSASQIRVSPSGRTIGMVTHTSVEYLRIRGRR
jgi:hypothetical protein